MTEMQKEYADQEQQLVHAFNDMIPRVSDSKGASSEQGRQSAQYDLNAMRNVLSPKQLKEFD